METIYLACIAVVLVFWVYAGIGSALSPIAFAGLVAAIWLNRWFPRSDFERLPFRRPDNPTNCR